jgi:glutamate racemase
MLKTNNSTVTIIDSGIGGISILKELIKKYKYGNFIYYADNEYMPYGNKPSTWLKEHIKEIINELRNKYHSDLIILACNTASTCIEEKGEDIIKMEFMKDKIYLATPLTKKNLKGINIIADETLAKDIETNITNKIKLNNIIKEHIKQHKLNKLKQLVLGCTHYELVNDVFKKYCPNTEIINNSSYMLNKIILKETNEFNLIIKTTKKDEKLEQTIRYLITE